MTGPLALVGSGEFTPAMADVDAWLLDCAEAAGFDRVVAVLPTASAPDGEKVFQGWLEKAETHYATLDAEVLRLEVRDRTAAAALGPIADVEHAGLVYLSGGKPDHLTEVLRGTPLLDAIVERWQLGAALAGCSAGAMAISSGWPPFMRPGGPWGHGLGLLPDFGCVPHFDRVKRMSLGAIGRVGRHAPAGWLTVGIDEDTALVRPDTSDDTRDEIGDGQASAPAWHTRGRGGSWQLGHEGVVPLDHTLMPSPSRA